MHVEFRNYINDINSNLIKSANDGIGRDEMEAYEALIRENISYEILLERYPHEEELLEGILGLILETVLCRNSKIVIASNEYSTELVKSKLLKLNHMHIEYVIGCLQKNTTKVKNIKKYLLASIFNAPNTISGYYRAEVNYDFPQYVTRG
jgi:Leu/Phe-tRNA-protein transferase